MFIVVFDHKNTNQKKIIIKNKLFFFKLRKGKREKVANGKMMYSRLRKKGDKGSSRCNLSTANGSCVPSSCLAVENESATVVTHPRSNGF